MKPQTESASLPITSADLVRVLVKDIAGLPRGAVIVVNSETGDYTIGTTADEALRTFETRFGWGVPAYVHVVT